MLISFLTINMKVNFKKNTSEKKYNDNVIVYNLKNIIIYLKQKYENEDLIFYCNKEDGETKCFTVIKESKEEENVLLDINKAKYYSINEYYNEINEKNDIGYLINQRNIFLLNIEKGFVKNSFIIEYEDLYYLFENFETKPLIFKDIEEIKTFIDKKKEL